MHMVKIRVIFCFDVSLNSFIPKLTFLTLKIRKEYMMIHLMLTYKFTRRQTLKLGKSAQTGSSDFHLQT
jgi:hypothetical protein